MRVEEVNQLLVVSYRHMYVREINPQNRTTRPWVAPRRVGRTPPVALRAPSAFRQHRNPGRRSVTDVLAPAVTHVLTPNSMLCPGDEGGEA